MYTAIFDSHAHYDDAAFDSDRDSVLTALPAQGVCGVLNCADSHESCLKTLELAGRYSYIYAACGVHPHNAENTDWCVFEGQLRGFLREERCVAVGEIGLDYHYDFSPREAQLDLFERQLRLALELDMPVVVHDREAHADCLRLLKLYRPKGVMHCYSGSVEMAEELIAFGMYLGLGGAVTFPNAKKPRTVAAWVPQDRLLLETDCPYMTPVPFRGKRNSSAWIPYTAEAIAALRGTDAQTILNITEENTCRLFGISDIKC